MLSSNHLLSSDQKKLQPLTPSVFLILFALADGEKHGYAIMQQAGELSNHQFHMGPGTLYTTIQRLVEFKLIEESASSKKMDARRRIYRLTSVGKAMLGQEFERMRIALQTSRKMKFSFEET